LKPINPALIDVAKLLPAVKAFELHLDVQDRYREAAMVLWRCPRTAEDRYLSSADRCSWPPYVRDFWTHYGQEKARMPKIPAQPKDIDRMEELLQWHSWLATQDGMEAKIVWHAFALKWRMKVIGRRFGLHRNSVRKMAKSGVQRIMEEFLLGG